MKTVLTISVLLMLLFNWIGYEFYNTVVVQIGKNSSDMSPSRSDDFGESDFVPYQMLNFHIPTYQKILDFDDLFEFTTARSSEPNQIVFYNVVDFNPDRANRENQRIGFKCFNGEYYSGGKTFFNKENELQSTGKLPDNYKLIIPQVFLSPKGHPPQIFG